MGLNDFVGLTEVVFFYCAEESVFLVADDFCGLRELGAVVGGDECTGGVDTFGE